MADLAFNGVPFVSDPMSFPRDRVFFIDKRLYEEVAGLSKPGSFARHIARQHHYERLLRPKYKRGHRKFKEASRG